MMYVEQLDITELKRFVRRRLGSYPITCEMVSSEPDGIYVSEFVTKSLVWLRLLEMESRRRESR